MNEIDIEIGKAILKSRKYKDIYPETVYRVSEKCVKNFGEKRALKETKNLLHQIWGAYSQKPITYDKLLTTINKGISEKKDPRDILPSILVMHSSTKERLPFLKEFYEKIFKITGIPNSTIDHACGLNPLTIPWINLPANSKYTAYDIDNAEVNFLNEAVKLFKFSQDIKIEAGDVLSDKTYPYADIVFMLKLLPVIEQQAKGRSFELIERQNCKYAVISFPAASISGRKRKMGEFYVGWFESEANKRNWNIAKLAFDSEIVFVVKK